MLAGHDRELKDNDVRVTSGHVCVQQAAGSDGDHKGAGNHQVDGHGPAGNLEIPVVRVFNHHNVELSWQADNRQHGHQGLGEERRCLYSVGGQGANQVRLGGFLEQVTETVEQPVPDEQADSDKGDQFDQGFEGHRLDHATVVFRRLQVAGAEQHGEHGQGKGDVPGRIVPGRSTDLLVGIAGAGQYVEAEGNGFQLQGDVRHAANQREDCHHGCQQL